MPILSAECVEDTTGVVLLNVLVMIARVLDTVNFSCGLAEFMAQGA